MSLHQASPLHGGADRSNGVADRAGARRVSPPARGRGSKHCQGENTHCPEPSAIVPRAYFSGERGERVAATCRNRRREQAGRDFGMRAIVRPIQIRSSKRLPPREDREFWGVRGGFSPRGCACSRPVRNRRWRGNMNAASAVSACLALNIRAWRRPLNSPGPAPAVGGEAPCDQVAPPPMRLGDCLGQGWIPPRILRPTLDAIAGAPQRCAEV